MNESFSKADVRNLQRNLNKLGYSAGKVDGQFGANTEKALTNYLSDNGISQAEANTVANKLRKMSNNPVSASDKEPLSDDAAAKKANKADAAGVKAKNTFSKQKSSAKQQCSKTPKCPEAGKLGNLSAKYESGNRGSAAIGYDNTGGWSYGKYQIETKRGTMNGFLNYVKTASPDVYQQLDGAGGYDAALAGNNEFKNAWKIAAKEPSFETLQHDYIASKNYSPLSSKVQEETGLNVSERSAAVQDVVWSVAVQHGPGSSVISNALKDKDVAKMTDDEIIDVIYDERSATKVNKAGDTVLKYFSKSTKSIQDGVAARYKQERKCAKHMLETENQ
ncbi:peptidoglycan-binding domain-containing protein [Methylobacter sp.]|jgi:peptidoglycan hydrolase-like protein with peptidoglycan-binding domain|uniref:peptidoglycan-binding domain-containing protein n=1 Tax=Methylobacter sp. TaxID=2051955 RepID=UPI003DA434E7